MTPEQRRYRPAGCFTSSLSLWVTRPVCPSGSRVQFVPWSRPICPSVMSSLSLWVTRPVCPLVTSSLSFGHVQSVPRSCPVCHVQSVPWVTLSLSLGHVQSVPRHVQSVLWSCPVCPLLHVQSVPWSCLVCPLIKSSLSLVTSSLSLGHVHFVPWVMSSLSLGHVQSVPWSCPVCHVQSVPWVTSSVFLGHVQSVPWSRLVCPLVMSSLSLGSCPVCPLVMSSLSLGSCPVCPLVMSSLSLGSCPICPLGHVRSVPWAMSRPNTSRYFCASCQSIISCVCHVKARFKPSYLWVMSRHHRCHVKAKLKPSYLWVMSRHHIYVSCPGQIQAIISVCHVQAKLKPLYLCHVRAKLKPVYLCVMSRPNSSHPISLCASNKGPARSPPCVARNELPAFLWSRLGSVKGLVNRHAWLLHLLLKGCRKKRPTQKSVGHGPVHRRSAVSSEFTTGWQVGHNVCVVARAACH